MSLIKISKVERYLSEYLGTGFVFAIDFLISFVSSALVLLMLNYVTSLNCSQLKLALVWMGASVAGTLLSMFLLKSYKVVIRHTSIRDIMGFVMTVSLKGIIMLVALCVLVKMRFLWLIAIVFDVTVTLAVLLLTRLLMILLYDAYKSRIKDISNRQRVLIYGTSEKSVAASTRLKDSTHYRIVGYLSEDFQTSNVKLNGQSVYSYQDDQHLSHLIETLSVSAILFANERDAKSQENGIIQYCLKNKIHMLIIPSVEEVAAGKVMRNNIRHVKIEDLLGRDEIKISMDEIRAEFKDKVVMVTGAAGSIGSELCRQLAGFDVKKIILYDNAETPMHYVRLELEERYPRLDFVPIIGDVRIQQRLDYAFREYRPQIVFHAAAYKHVPLMEENPCEAVLVNVFGTRNVADKCLEYGVEKMVMISTDKAVNPTNIMGCSKRLAEIYVQSLAHAIESGEVHGETRFVTTRFGNVLGSNGSVIPRFREQIEKGGPVTVTHPEINRFFMTIPEACRLVMEAATMGYANRIFVFDMGDPVKIVDLARRMIELSGLKVGEDIEIQYTGLRPGEKLFEEVLATAEDTDPTSHDRIRIARTREYDYKDASDAVVRLEQLSRSVNIPDMVRLMKQVVPEFKSRNSRFELFDREK